MKIHMGNLSKDISDAQLGDLVREFGAYESAEVAKDRASGESRGFGFVVFTSDDDAKKAIEGLNGKEVNGSVLKVSEARPKEARAGH